MAERTSVSPYLVSDDPAGVVRFLEEAFDGEERFERHLRPDGSIQHTQVTIGDSIIMIGGADATMPCLVHIYVDDAEATYQRALAAGAKSVAAPEDDPTGDRRGGVDLGGIQFWMANPTT